MIVVLAVALVFAGTAQARYLPYGAAYRAALLNTLEAGSLSARTDLEICQRTTYGQVACPAWLKEDRFEYIERAYPYNSVYRHLRCDWTAVVHWSGRRIVVNRRFIVCRAWEDYEREQP